MKSFIFLISLFFVSAYAEEDDVLVLTKDNFETETKNGNILVEFCELQVIKYYVSI